MYLAARVQRLKAAVKTAYTRLASRRPKRVDASRLDDVLSIMERDAWLKGAMLDELREAVRVGEGRPFNRSSHVDLVELVRSTAESLEPVAREGDVTVRVKCAAASLVIAADAEDLTRIVGRVLACAIAASDRGSSVDCGLSLDADWIRLVVRVHAPDTASMPRAAGSAGDRSEILASTWERLGLEAVRALVELHGGGVWVEIEDPRLDPILTVRLPGDRAVQRPADGGSVRDHTPPTIRTSQGGNT